MKPVITLTKPNHETINKYCLLLVLITFYTSVSKAQEMLVKKTVGIAQFSSEVKNKSIASDLQQLVVEVLSNRKHITTLDRSNDLVLNKELNNQKDINFINSQVLAEQGIKLGAQEMLAGTLTSVDAERKENDQKGNSAYNYTGKASFSLQIINVSTGAIKVSKTFSISAASFSIMGLPLIVYNTPEEAMNNVVRANRFQII